ncbi:hypothetical protein [Paenibacillus wynnii]|uniref:Lipoprotein n=1 Tax=Paenibacillus wynnii TaxID=268407 RepID=A0A098MFE4_9BACL|nr:hypothetical protein [Paenibacillus wynnii]KGE20758.1 hypothetical protein PWYN_00840 [Paenibacillus wynnii]
MKKLFLFVIALNFFLLSSCSPVQKYTSVIEAIESQEINLTEVESPKNAEMDDIKPLSYTLDNNDILRVYDFGTEETRELGYKHFYERQQSLSSHAPIIFQPGNFLVLYYSNASPTTQTPKLSETKYGAQIKKGLTSLK